MAEFFSGFDYAPGVVTCTSTLDDAAGFDEGANQGLCAFQDLLLVQYPGDIFLDVSIFGEEGARTFEVRVYKSEYDGQLFYLERGPASYAKLRECVDRGLDVARATSARQ